MHKIYGQEYNVIDRRKNMKKAENRNMVPYPIYPPYQGISPMMPNNPMMSGNPMMPGVPMMGNPMPYSMGSTNTGSCSSNTTNTDSLKEDLESLNKRVSYLESVLLNNTNSNYSTNYNSSNYQVM